jgi:hypothetical protein
MAIVEENYRENFVFSTSKFQPKIGAYFVWRLQRIAIDGVDSFERLDRASDQALLLFV